MRARLTPERGVTPRAGYELYDLFAFLMRFWPYSDYMKRSTELVLVFHHIPGLMLAGPIITQGLYKSRNLQVIGTCLLAAGAVSVGVGCITHTIDVQKERGAAFGLQLFTYCFYVTTRFGVFPYAAWGFLNEVQGREQMLVLAVKVGIALMTTFNVVILMDLSKKTYRYGKRWLDGGKTVLNVDPVPLSKEARAKQEAAKKGK